MYRKIVTVLNFSIGILSTFWTETKIFSRFFSRYLIGLFLDSYLHYTKYRNLILFPGDEIVYKQSVVRDNSLYLILISEAAAWKFFSMDAFEKGSCIPYLGYKHFVTRRITLIRYMLNKFKIEFKELFFFRISLQKYLTVAFQWFLSKFR